jgi:hypothetical protein
MNRERVPKPERNPKPEIRKRKGAAGSKKKTPIEDYEAMMETMDLLSNPKAMRVLRAAKAGKLAYKKLDLEDDNFGR